MGERIREIREQNELTLKEMSGKLNYSFSYISDIERGKAEPSREFLKRLNDAFGASSDDILYGSPGERAQNLFVEYKMKFDRLKDLKAIPKDSISEEEEAILRVLRLIGQKDSLVILRELLKSAEKKEEREPLTFVGPLEKPLKVIREIVERGKWKEGTDYEMLLWGLDDFIKWEKVAKETLLAKQKELAEKRLLLVEMTKRKA